MEQLRTHFGSKALLVAATTTGSAETSQTTSTTVTSATTTSTGPQDRTLAAEVVSIGEPVIEPPEPTLFRDETTVLPGVNDGFPVSTQDAPDGLQGRNHNGMRGKRP